jgi:hypothetical protein
MSEPIYIVSGLPRSGTSMMMRMLDAGGLEIVVDNIRAADDDNPRGYYEFETVKKIEEDKSWLPDARGKVVKMISMLLQHLPADYNYKIIFMERRIEEVLASQAKMLVRRNETGSEANDAAMAAMFGKHLEKTRSWMEAQTNIDVIYIPYGDTVSNPSGTADLLKDFIDHNLDTAAMIEAVDPSLHRNR